MGYGDLRDFLVALEEHGMLRRVTRPVERSWELACIARWPYQAVPARERFGLLFEKGSDGRDTGLGGQVSVPVEALTHAAQFGRHLRGTHTPGTREAHQDATILRRSDVVFDTGGEQPDLLDHPSRRARQVSRELAPVRHLRFLADRCGGAAEPLERLLGVAPAAATLRHGMPAASTTLKVLE